MGYNKIIDFIKKCYGNVPLYKNLEQKYGIDEITQIKDVPVIGKKEFISKQDECINPEYCTKYIDNKLLLLRTSGSTGHYLEIMWDIADINRSLVELWLRRAKNHGIFPHNRLVLFFTDFTSDDKYRHKKNELGISKQMLLPNNIADAYENILEWDPEWMILQPGTAVLLIEFIKRTHCRIPASLKYVEFTGEVLEDSVRKSVEDIFGCTTANQYGANEVGSIAYECPNGNLHLMKSNVYVEIVNEDDIVIADSIKGVYAGDYAEGRIVVTSLTNNAMPFIRYDIGDEGVIVNNKCDCGCSSPILKLYSGRQNDFIMLKDGSKASPYIFVGIIDTLNSITEGAVLQFYIIQSDYDKFIIRLYTEEDREEINEIILGLLDEEYPYKAEFIIEFVNTSMQVGVNGKYTYFRNKIDCKSKNGC